MYAVWLLSEDVKDRVTLTLRLEGVVATIGVMRLKSSCAIADFKSNNRKRVRMDRCGKARTRQALGIFLSMKWPVMKN